MLKPVAGWNRFLFLFKRLGDLSEISSRGRGGGNFKFGFGNEVTDPCSGSEICQPFPWAWPKLSWPSPSCINDKIYFLQYTRVSQYYENSKYISNLFFEMLYTYILDDSIKSPTLILRADHSTLLFLRYISRCILGDPGADSGGEGKSKLAEKYGTTKK